MLDVTPQIDEDGNIILHVHPSVSEVTESTRVVNLGGTHRPDPPAARQEHGERDRHHRARQRRQHRRHRRPDERRRARQPRRPARVTEGGLGDLLRNTDRRSAKKELVILIKPTVIAVRPRLGAGPARDARALRTSHPAAGEPEVTVNYLKHFGLREPPFGITPDTSFFFACRSIQEALNTLLVAVDERRRLHQDHRRSRHRQDAAVPQVPRHARRSWVTAYIPNPYLEPRTLLLALAEELGVRGRRARRPAPAAEGADHARCSTSRARASASCCAWTRRRRCRSRRWRRCAC